MRPEAPPAADKRQNPIRITAVLAVAAAIGFVVWLVVRHNDHGSSSAKTTTTSQTTGRRIRPLLTAATPRTLRTVAAAAGHPLYWAGPLPGKTYELTRTTDGRLYVRYLPKGVRIGNRSGKYLLIGTYPVSNAYAAVQRAGREPGATTFRLKRGALAVVNSSAATNVYFAYPHTNYQVEVFDPNAQAARRLVASGAIRPVG